MKRKLSDAVSAVVLIVLSIAGLLQTRNFSESAALLPKITLWGILILSAIQLVKARFVPDETVEINLKRMGIVVLALLAYVLLINVLGYYVSTLLFIAGLMAAFGVRRPRTLIAVPVIFCVFVFAVFAKGLSISLPRGLLF